MEIREKSDKSTIIVERGIWHWAVYLFIGQAHKNIYIYIILFLEVSTNTGK